MLPYKAKSDFTNVIKLRFLRWEDYPGLCNGPKISTRSLKEGSKKVKDRRKRQDNRIKGQNDARKGL